MINEEKSGASESGQAFTELLVGVVVIALFLFGAHHLWRYGEAQQASVEAVRFAAWERTAWEPSDNDLEKHALHKSDQALATDTVLHQLSTPIALRKYREDISAEGTPPAYTAEDRRGWLKSALKTFVAPGNDPNAMVSISTSSGWTNEAQRQYRGRDPTLNTTTSLELDQDTYRTVKLSIKSPASTVVPHSFFGFPLASLDTEKKLSLITNTWAGSPPMQRVRTVRQLLPFSSGDPTSGTKPNVLAFFGLNHDPDATNAADFIGMYPWWNFLGGANGLAGQYVVRQVGLDANGANSLLRSAGQNYQFNPGNPATSLLLKAQVHQNEYFDPNYARSMVHRHEKLKDLTAEAVSEKAGGPKARNSNEGNRKYRAVSLQNPAETYFAE